MDQHAPPRAVVVVAHGSRAAGANEAHQELCAELAVRLHGAVYPAFLEVATPTVPDAIARAVSDGHRRIAVLPHFLAPGNHTTRDIPALVDEARRAHPDIDLEVLEHTGADPGLVALMAARLPAE